MISLWRELSVSQLKIGLIAAAIVCFGGNALGTEAKDSLGVGTDTQEASINEKLMARIDLDLKFQTENGESLPLSQILSGQRPVILSLVYYSCPGLCNAYLNGLNDALKTLSMSAGKDFDVVAVSFNPKEAPALAQSKKQSYLTLYGRTGAENGWRFLTGPEASTRALTESVGFGYYLDSASGEWIHQSAAIFLAPDGQVIRYLKGAFFGPKSVRLAITEASQGRAGYLSDRIFLKLSEFDVSSNKYKLSPLRLALVVIAVTALLAGLAVVFVYFLRKAKLKRPEAQS